MDWDEVKAIFKGLDKDGDKSVVWEEFFVRLFHGHVRNEIKNSMLGRGVFKSQGSALEILNGEIN